MLVHEHRTNGTARLMEPESKYIELSPGSVRFFLGRPYTGSDADDGRLRAAVLADGGPGWVRGARIERDGERLRLVRVAPQWR